MVEQRSNFVFVSVLCCAFMRRCRVCVRASPACLLQAPEEFVPPEPPTMLPAEDILPAQAQGALPAPAQLPAGVQ